MKRVLERVSEARRLAVRSSTLLAILLAVTFFVGLDSYGQTAGQPTTTGPLELSIVVGNKMVSSSTFPAGDFQLLVANNSDSLVFEVAFKVGCTYANDVRQAIIRNQRETLGPGQAMVLFVAFPISKRAELGVATVSGRAVARVVGAPGLRLSDQDSDTFELVP